MDRAKSYRGLAGREKKCTEIKTHAGKFKTVERGFSMS